METTFTEKVREQDKISTYNFILNILYVLRDILVCERVRSETGVKELSLSGGSKLLLFKNFLFDIMSLYYLGNQKKYTFL